MNPVDAIKLLAGKVGSAANRILTATPKPIKQAAGVLASIQTGGAIPSDIYTKERGVTEQLQNVGGDTQRRLIETNPNISTEEKKKQLAALEKQSGGSAITTSPNPNIGSDTASKQAAAQSGSIDPNTVSNLMSERAMGANVGDVRDFGGTKWRWNGAIWENLTPSSGGGEPPLSGEDITKAITDIPGALDFLDENALKGIYDKYAGESRGRAGELAAEIENAARENAEREYKTTLDALGIQKGEVTTLSTQQRERLKAEGKLTEEELKAKEEKETKAIEGERAGFQEEIANTKEELARNWRDLSMEVQRIARARGIADSAFAASKETGLLMDFNKGLRKIASQSTDALTDFADAIIETNKFYTREQEKLSLNLQTALQDVDNWERQQVQKIQAQENVALNNKLADIRNAVVEAKQLRVNTEQKIADQQLALGTWIIQFQAQMKAAVATAAAGKVEDAWKNISNVRQNATIVNTLLQNGGEIIPTKDEKGNISGGTLHGYLPTADGSYEEVTLPLTAGFTQTKTLETAANIAGKVPDETLGSVYGQLYGTSPGVDKTVEKPSAISSILYKIGDKLK